MQHAVSNVRDEIAKALVCKEAGDQREVDQRLRDLDGTPNKSRLGANAILAVTVAYTRAMTSSRKLPLYRHLGGDDATLLPVPCVNVISGGRHADNTVTPPPAKSGTTGATASSNPTSANATARR